MCDNASVRTVRPSLLLLGATAMAWGTGCGGGGNNPDAAPSGEVAAEVSSGSPYCTDKPALPGMTDVSGTWVIRAVATQIVTAPIVNTLRPQTVFYILTSLAQSGTSVIATGWYCDRAEIDQPGSLTTVVIPDQWAHTEKPVSRVGTFAVDASGVPILTFPTLVELAGAVADATTDALPVDVSDPRVIDEDHDGHPGITVTLTGVVSGSLYVVQRQTTAIAAIPVASDRFEGKLDFTSEQKVLDSTSPVLTSLYGQAVASPDTTPCSSTFTMVKVADLAGPGGLDASAIDASSPDGGGTLGCAWVRANEAALFP
jgi:hypothetical protein